MSSAEWAVRAALAAADVELVDDDIVVLVGGYPALRAKLARLEALVSAEPSPTALRADGRPPHAPS